MAKQVPAPLVANAPAVPRRYPRESYCIEGKEKEYIATLAALSKQIRRIEASRVLSKKVRLEMGLLCIDLKRSVHHGLWRDCYQSHFGQSGVPLDRAREYMKRADKKGVRRLRGAADRGGPEAKARRAEARKAKEELGRRREQKIELDSNFKRLTGELVRQQDWPQRLGELTNVLRECYSKNNIEYPATVIVLEVKKHEHAEA